MLVLSRMTNEVFYIGPDIKVTILQTSSRSTKVGIEAPQSFKITRDNPPLPQEQDDQCTQQNS